MSSCRDKTSAGKENPLSAFLLTKDLGTILVGQQAVEEHIIDEVGGISQALRKIYAMIGGD